ncbi:MAG: hypothetical protein NT149_01455 [Candidatus Gottesmanbacteria bacterium]|nr:hypothetical protein [Candidatus Gottesmanbacteria bacterium]
MKSTVETIREIQAQDARNAENRKRLSKENSKRDKERIAREKQSEINELEKSKHRISNATRLFESSKIRYEIDEIKRNFVEGKFPKSEIIYDFGGIDSTTFTFVWGMQFDIGTTEDGLHQYLVETRRFLWSGIDAYEFSVTIDPSSKMVHVGNDQWRKLTNGRASQEIIDDIAQAFAHPIRYHKGPGGPYHDDKDYKPPSFDEDRPPWF